MDIANVSLIMQLITKGCTIGKDTNTQILTQSDGKTFITRLHKLPKSKITFTENGFQVEAELHYCSMYTIRRVLPVLRKSNFRYLLTRKEERISTAEIKRDRVEVLKAIKEIIFIRNLH